MTGWDTLLARLPRVTDYHLYWTERYTPEQVHRLALGMYGDAGQTAPVRETRIAFCLHCEAEFTVTARTVSNKKFCSSRCAKTYWYEHTDKGRAWRDVSNRRREERRNQLRQGRAAA